jgi:predicted peptidase
MSRSSFVARVQRLRGAVSRIPFALRYRRADLCNSAAHAAIHASIPQHERLGVLSRNFLAAFFLFCIGTQLSSAAELEDVELAKFWTPGVLHVPYRAIVTPGRRDHELLPLIVFLHGDWQDGTDNESQLAGRGNGSYELVDTARDGDVPLVYIAPQTTGAYWPPDRVVAVVRDALARWPVDPRRIYLTGISDGGAGVWDALKAYPRCFAAGVPMSGMTELAGLGPIRDIPQWVFHGEKDDDTDVETGYDGAMVGSRAVVRSLRAMGGTPRYTEYPGEKHVIWPRAYAEDALLPWMLDQRLRGKPCNFAASAR